MKNYFVSTEKTQDMLCGPACLQYLCSIIYSQKDISIPNNLLWITDIASFIYNELKYDIILSCYKSKLYTDYSKGILPPDFEGYKSLNNYEYLSCPKILQRKISIFSLQCYLKKGHYIILNVSSSIFNNDPNLTGGHFIMIVDYDSQFFKVVNPTSTQIKIVNISKNTIINSCKFFGNWMLCIRKSQ